MPAAGDCRHPPACGGAAVRNAAKRDTTERGIIQALEADGWRVVQVSDKGFPDLFCARRGAAVVLDAKSVGGVLQPAQLLVFQEMEKGGVLVGIVVTPEEAVSVANTLADVHHPNLIRNPQIIPDFGIRTWRDMRVDDRTKPGRKSRPRLRIPAHLR